MAGKSIYFTDKELKMIRIAFDQYNYHFEGDDLTDEEAEEKYSLAESIRNKVKQ